MAKNTKGKKTVESVAETLCSFSRFLCDLVIGIYLFVILAVLPLYNRGYACLLYTSPSPRDRG